MFKRQGTCDEFGLTKGQDWRKSLDTNGLYCLFMNLT